MAEKGKKEGTEKKQERKGFWRGIRETIYGMAAHDMSRAALRTRASMEQDRKSTRLNSSHPCST
jgi:hypothetical protein